MQVYKKANLLIQIHSSDSNWSSSIAQHIPCWSRACKSRYYFLQTGEKREGTIQLVTSF